MQTTQLTSLFPSHFFLFSDANSPPAAASPLLSISFIFTGEMKEKQFPRRKSCPVMMTTCIICAHWFLLVGLINCLPTRTTSCSPLLLLPLFLPLFLLLLPLLLPFSSSSFSLSSALLPGLRVECQTCFYDTRFASVMADHLRDDAHTRCVAMAIDGATAVRKARPGPASKTIRKGAEMKNVQVRGRRKRTSECAHARTNARCLIQGGET